MFYILYLQSWTKPVEANTNYLPKNNINTTFLKKKLLFPPSPHSMLLEIFSKFSKRRAKSTLIWGGEGGGEFSV